MVKHNAFGAGEKPIVPTDLKRKFYANTKRKKGGHLEWHGSRSTSNGTPFIYYRGNQVSSAAVAFILRTGEWPVGYVKEICGRKQCCGVKCVEDARGRARMNDLLYSMGLISGREYARKRNRSPAR